MITFFKMESQLSVQQGYGEEALPTNRSELELSSSERDHSLQGYLPYFAPKVHHESVTEIDTS